MDIATRLRAARKAAGLKQEQLAHRCGTSFMTISEAERGKSTPRLETIAKFAEALNVTPEWLAYGIGDGPAAEVA